MSKISLNKKTLFRTESWDLKIPKMLRMVLFEYGRRDGERAVSSVLRCSGS